MCVFGHEPGGPNLGPCGVAGVWRTGHAAQGAAGALAGNIEEGFSKARAGIWPGKRARTARRCLLFVAGQKL